MSTSIAELRTAIDTLDQQLLQLLNQRATLANAIGDIKRQEGSQVYRPEREAQVIHKLQTANQGPLKADSVANIWREVMSACRALEEPHRVAYLGPEGTFSEQAAEAFFGVSIERVPCASFDEVFEATTSGRAAFGVVPMENSTEGVVTRSLDLFLTSPLHIIGEVSLLIRHNLLSQQRDLQKIQAVYAHPQALAQCQNWLNAHLPHAERHATASNAELYVGAVVVLFLFDLVVPDLVPFVDEILLGLGAALFGMWRERVPANAVKADKPPEKNVTPPG